ncbi:HlyD family secretion protein [Rhodobacteraceae bacterium DSL-40]|uniref:HlyD family secretion protein n=1 Tax=Amaricoccus sp. B4 TaxID=3368557 RepID=UPI000DAE5351
MVELVLCSLLTILPDYLLRRHFQGKRWGHEITFFTMWYELRWGITACVMLTVTLITIVFYFHPSTTNASPFFRTVSILPEGGGRVREVYAANSDVVEAGKPIFAFDDSSQQAAVDAAKQRVVEAEAAFAIAQAQIAVADGTIHQAEGAYQQALDELETKTELRKRNPDVVTTRELERLQNLADGRFGSLEAARAQKTVAENNFKTVLPAQLASAEAAQRQAEVELSKTVVYAGVTGRLEQFTLRPGDYVSPILRPAGILVPLDAGRDRVQAGFDQLSASVIKPGMAAEISCASKAFTVIPMVVTDVQDVIAAGQIRPADGLMDAQDSARPGTITVFMEPLYAGQLDDILPGSKCVANAYTDNHERLAEEDLGLGTYLFLHLVDTVGFIHALILRIQVMLMPIMTLVFSGH